MNLNMFDDFEEEAGSSGSWISQLSQADRDALESWVQTLKAIGMTEASARSYKSYVAQATVRLSRGESFESLTNDVKSGVRKYKAYRKANKKSGDSES